MEQIISRKYDFIFNTENGKEIKFRFPAPEAELTAEELRRLGHCMCRVFRARNGKKLTDLKSVTLITRDETDITDLILG